MIHIDDYSQAYYLLHADVLNYTGEVVAAPMRMLEELSRYVTGPLVHIDGTHYPLHVDNAVPADTVVLPQHIDAEDRNHVLIAKDDAALSAIYDNDVEKHG